MFTKIKSKLCSDKRGFTLAELLVTLVLLSLFLGLTMQFTTSFIRQYQKVEARWWVQTATRRVMDYLDQKAEPLNNSSQIDLFYMDDTTEVAYAETDDLNVMKGVPTVGNDKYAYIYTKPDENGNDIIYILERGVGNTPVNFTNQILGLSTSDKDVPLKIEFEVATSPKKTHSENVTEVVDNGEGETVTRVVQEPVTDKDGNALTDGNGNPLTNNKTEIIYGEGEDQYLYSTVTVTVSAGSELGGDYSLSTSFTLSNMLPDQYINVSGSELVATAGNCYVSGWANEKLGCPEYVNGASITRDANPHAADKANILRYVSAESFLDNQATGTSDVSIEGAGMCFGSLSMKGSGLEVQVTSALRDFRDNVLAKSALGNKIIEKYYNVWSPALLNIANEHPFLLKIGKAVLIPASVLAYFVAE